MVQQLINPAANDLPALEMPSKGFSNLTARTLAANNLPCSEIEIKVLCAGRLEVADGILLFQRLLEGNLHILAPLWPPLLPLEPAPAKWACATKWLAVESVRRAIAKQTRALLIHAFLYISILNATNLDTARSVSCSDCPRRGVASDFRIGRWCGVGW